MKCLGICVAIAILLDVGLGPSWGATLQNGLPESSLVVVMSRFFSGQQAGNGFVVGDGMLVVTSEHIVYEKSQKGEHRLEGFVGVYSPYLGEACDARILASDEDLDLAVLEVPWKGHPALVLGDANVVLEARSARIVGLPAVVKGLDARDAEGPAAELLQAEQEELPVAFVGVRTRVPLFVTLNGIGRIGPGWSGSPILLPDTSTAIGCFNVIRGNSLNQRAIGAQAAGAAVSRVPGLLGDGFDERRLRAATTSAQSPEDARAACSLALRASSLLRPGGYAAAREAALAFVKMRPRSGHGHKVLAYASEQLDQADAARESYRRAVELDPNSLNGQILYAQFLAAHGDPNQATQILESLWQTGRTRDLVAIGLVNLWGEQGRYSRCIEVAEEALRLNPRNAYLWQQMAGCRMQMREPGGAMESLTRAVELCPERGPLRGSLAHLLEQAGKLDEAERHFRALLEVEPENPVVHYWLALFLSKHRPQAAQEALKIAEKALDLPLRTSLPREKVEQLVAELRGR